MQVENVKLNNAMHALEVKKQDLNDKVDGFIDAGIRNLTGNVAEMTAIMHSLVAQTMMELDILKEPVLGVFGVDLKNAPTMWVVLVDVVFKTVLVNEGGGYDSNTGRFTASVAGVYMFTVQYTLFTNKWAFFELVHEGRPLQRSSHLEKDTAVSVSMQVFAKVSKGGKVWVRVMH
ncbi:hypothetical protein DPMN_192711 [Dreissena polymorpha]|uniref:C1q domain-containing protein n=1 Tax=Dreissena polymorpha TaxID=45954 RepID=A0A9D3Y575_DREPO|nr:hypothetical protein DPMN_192711 [Dreissena polymorpha]